MELKKNPEYDLTRKTGMFLNLGLTISLLLVIVAFEWPNRGDGALMDLGAMNEEFEDLVEIPITEHTPPPPPQIQIPEIKEIPDEQEIEKELDFKIDSEVDDKTVVEEIVFVSKPKEEDVDEIFTIVEDQPEFPGGWPAFYKYVGDRMKYPSQARRMGIEGRVFVSFVVERDGRVTDVQVVKGIGAGCDEEAIRVMQTIPNFKPGKQRGRPVRVKMQIPIVFKLAN
jgi:periplasmic protein TonB